MKAGDRSALVTGATGYIGWRLVPTLVAAGWTVVASGRRPRPAWLPTSVEYRPADLVEDELAGLVAGMSHVVHLAGASSSRSSQEEMDRVNVVGTGRLVAAARAGGVGRFVHMSSTSVYGEEVELVQPVREDGPLHPSRGYGKAKWGAEQAVWAAGRDGLEVVVLRPVTVYGPGAVKLMASAILDVAIERHAGLDRLAVPATAIEQRMVHIDDLVASTIHLLGHPDAPGRAFNVASGTYPSSHQVLGALAGEFGMTVAADADRGAGPSTEERAAVHTRMVAAGMEDRVLLTPERFRFMRKANRNNRVSLEALESTGFRPAETDLGASLAATVAWYRHERWIL